MSKTKRPPLLDEYSRCTAECPCPICGRDHYCLIHRKGLVAICTKVESKDKRGNAGWYHKVSDAKKVRKVPPPAQKVYLTPKQVQEYLRNLPPATAMLTEKAAEIGLSLDSILQLYARYESKAAVIAFPMFDEKRRPIGVRFRRADGRKWSLKGGREGVFVAREFRPDQPIFIAEGPTDAATLVESGFTNILGRPNCSGGTAIIKGMLGNNRYTPVVIVADPGPPGENGAADLANALPNPAIVIKTTRDLRDAFILAKEKHNFLTSDFKASILEGLDSAERTAFVTIHRNLPGKFFDFTKGIH